MRQDKTDIDAPGTVLRMMESRVMAESAQLLLALPAITRRAPRGSGRVLVLPGFMADDSSTWVLRRFLTTLGYTVSGWGMGQNRKTMLSFLAPMTARVASLAKSTNDGVMLVGWSRGGMLAREIARDRPDLVRQVITMGSPVRGGPQATSIGAAVMRETGMTVAAMQATMRERQRQPITVPITALYSRTDGVVAWQACIDDKSPNVRHIEVPGSHVGLGTNSRVFEIVAQTLAGQGRSPA